MLRTGAGWVGGGLLNKLTKSIKHKNKVLNSQSTSPGGKLFVDSPYKFLKTHLRNLKYNIKGTCTYVLFDFGWYSIHYDIPSSVVH